MSFHHARRSYGQLQIDQGYSVEAVAAMMGHSDTATTQKHYCRPGLARVVAEMSFKGLDRLADKAGNT